MVQMKKDAVSTRESVKVPEKVKYRLPWKLSDDLLHVQQSLVLKVDHMTSPLLRESGLLALFIFFLTTLTMLFALIAQGKNVLTINSPVVPFVWTRTKDAMAG